MKTDIRAHNFTLSPALRYHVNHRLAISLRRHRDRIARVSVRLADINGPRGGIDKHCQIQITLFHLPEVLIEDVEGDMYQAISRAVDRASRLVARRIERAHDQLASHVDSDFLNIEASLWQPATMTSSAPTHRSV